MTESEIVSPPKGVRSLTSWARTTIAAPLLIIPVVMLFLVSPQGDFPIVDDGVHMREVKTLLTEHRYAGDPPLVATLVAQALWGALFSSVLGLSYTTLRISTIALAYIGSWGMAKSARECGLPRSVAVLCGVALWCNPYYFIYSYSFMTEVPFTAVCTLSGLFYLRAFRNLRARDLVFGSIFALVAYFIRQHGILLIASAGFTLAFLFAATRDRIQLRQTVVVAICSIAFFAIIIAWQLARPENPNQGTWVKRTEDLFTFYKLKMILHYCVIMLAFQGLYTLPFCMLRIWRLFTDVEEWSIPHWLATFVLTSAGFVVLSFSLNPLRFGPDILHNLGCPVFYSLPSALSATDSPVPLDAGAPLRVVLAILSLFSASVLVCDVLAVLMPALLSVLRIRPKATYFPHTARVAFLTAWASAFVLSFTPFVPHIYWRYTVQLAPPAILLAALPLLTRPTRRESFAAFLPYACVFLVLVAFLQDYMGWNTARWKAVDVLTREMNISPRDINGGYEFNFMTTREEYAKLKLAGTPPEFKGWFVFNDEYALGFEPRPGYIELERFPYFSYIGFTERAVLILKRAPQPDATGSNP